MKFLLKYLLVFLSILLNGARAPFVPKTSIVEITQGKLKGNVLTSRGGRNYAAYLKIPYAQAGRFQAPIAPPAWTGVYQATTPGDECATTDPFTNQNRGTEDCLNLNVFTPRVTLLEKMASSSVDFLKRVSLNPLNLFQQINNAVTNFDKGLPVIVILNGGAFSLVETENMYEKLWMDREVVLVYPQFRLGPFGFLSTGNEIIPGNNGLKDQQMALLWIRANIRKFGGNPNNVILMGQGAGGASANFHMISPKSTGLFHGAILQSGCALNPWAISQRPVKMAFKFGKIVGCKNKDTGSLFACLLRKTTNEILDGIKKLRTKLGKGFPVSPFGPTVESPNPGSFLTMDPLTVMQAGVTNKVPVMMGLTETHFVFNQVSNMLHTPYLLKHLNHHWRKVFPLIFEYNKFYTNFSEESQNMISKQVRKFYFHGKSIDENQGEFLKQALSDRLFRSGMKQTIKLLAKHGPVYPFILASPKKSLNNGLPWIAGFDDGRSVLSNSMKTVMGYEKAVQAEKLLNIIQKLIVSFAKNKRPVDQTGGENPWNALDPSKISSQKPLMYYRIGLETTLVPEPFTAGVDFWEKTLRKAKKKNIG